MNTKPVETYSGIFPDKETFDEIYKECWENQPPASKEVMDAYQGMQEAFETYLCAVEKDWFRYAYQCGYEAGIKCGVV